MSIVIHNPISVTGLVEGDGHGTVELDEAVLMDAGFDVMAGYDLLDEIEEFFGGPLQCIAYPEIDEIMVSVPDDEDQPWMTLGRLAHLVRMGMYPTEGERVHIDKKTMELSYSRPLIKKYSYGTKSEVRGNTARFYLPLPYIDQKDLRNASQSLRIAANDPDGTGMNLTQVRKDVLDGFYLAVYGLTQAEVLIYVEEHGDTIVEQLDVLRRNRTLEVRLQERIDELQRQLTEVQDQTHRACFDIFPG